MASYFRSALSSGASVVSPAPPSFTLPRAAVTPPPRSPAFGRAASPLAPPGTPPPPDEADTPSPLPVTPWLQLTPESDDAPATPLSSAPPDAAAAPPSPAHAAAQPQPAAARRDCSVPSFLLSVGEALQGGVHAVVVGAEFVAVHTSRAAHDAWCATSGAVVGLVHAAARAQSAQLRVAGEPDDEFLTWRRCRRCQLQFDCAPGAASSPCRYHAARFECGRGGGGADPFVLRHRGATPCADDCEGRFPCCGARAARNDAHSSGCRSAPAHIAA